MLTLVRNTLEEELGAICLVEELGAFDHDGINVSIYGSRKERGNAGCHTEASHCWDKMSIAQKSNVSFEVDIEWSIVVVSRLSCNSRRVDLMNSGEAGAQYVRTATAGTKGG
jgi:hypothetical protein